MPSLLEGEDFERDEAKRTVVATEAGLAKVERALGIEGIYDDASGMLANHLQQALRAQFLFRCDDNQLRGRSGRQGDPGSSQFFISLEDDLMQRFGGDRADSLRKMMVKGGGEGRPVQSPAVTKAIESAQRQVEAMHFGMRKTLLEYDEVMNAQRKAVYNERKAILDGKDLTAGIPKVIEDAARSVVAKNCPSYGVWNVQAVEKWASEMTGQGTFKVSNVRHEGDPAKLANALTKYLKALYSNKESQLSEPVMQVIATQVMMRSIDARWMSHLRDMDALKTGISLRAIGHRDPKLEYKEEAHKAFAALTQSMYEDYLQALLRGQLTVKLKET